MQGDSDAVSEPAVPGATRDPLDDASASLAALLDERPVRRVGGRATPLGAKAARTRQRILAAAARVFAERGYQASGMADVADAAGLSLGAVYQYFSDRTDLVGALVRSNVRAMMSNTDTEWRVEDGFDGLYRIIHNFVLAYAAVPGMVAVWEEVSHVVPALGELRRRIGREMTAAVEAELRRARERHRIRADLDPVITAVALAGMVDRYCYVTYVFDPPPEGPPPPDDVADVLARVWGYAVGLDRADLPRIVPRTPESALPTGLLSLRWLAEVRRLVRREETLRLPDGVVTVHEVVTGVPGGDVEWWVRFGADDVDVGPGSPDGPGAPDVTCTSDLETATALASGTLDFEAALVSGRFRVSAPLAVIALLDDRLRTLHLLVREATAALDD